MLAELQLFVFGLDCEDLGHPYAFLKLCNCPELKKIFVQVAIFIYLNFIKFFTKCVHNDTTFFRGPYITLYQ